MAGFHFNSALFRLLAVYHRSLKVATNRTSSRKHIGDEQDSKSLISITKKTYLGWMGQPWINWNITKVHNEVNELKHGAKGIYWGRRVKENVAVSAVSELLSLLEAWSSQP